MNYATWTARARYAEQAVRCPLCGCHAGQPCASPGGGMHSARARYWRREVAADVLCMRTAAASRGYSEGQLTMREVVTLTAHAMVLFEAEARRYAD